MADTDERAAVAERGAGRRAGCERSLPERHRRRDQRRGRRGGDGGGPCGPAHRDRVDPRDVPGRRDRGRRGGRAQDGPRDGRRVGDRPDRRHQQLRPRHPRLGTRRSRPSSTANRSPRPPSRPRWATCTPPTRTARTATESRCASVTCLIHGGPRWTRRCGGTSTPVTSTPPPARRSIVRRFSDLRRFGAAQIVLPTVAAGGLEGTISNLRANPWDSVAGVFMVRQAGESDGYRGEPLATRLNRARRLERESPTTKCSTRRARSRTRLRGRLHCEESEATLTQTAACRARAAPRGAVVEDGRADEQRGADEQDEADLVEHGHREPRCRFAERDGDARDEQHDPEVDGHRPRSHMQSPRSRSGHRARSPATAQ